MRGAYHTDVDLFAKEIKYLHDNGFRVLTMRDLSYDDNTKSLYLANKWLKIAGLEILYTSIWSNSKNIEYS